MGKILHFFINRALAHARSLTDVKAADEVIIVAWKQTELFPLVFQVNDREELVKLESTSS